MDVLTIARERRGALRNEISELDGFIRMAERLIDSDRGITAPYRHRAGWPESLGDAESVDEDTDETDLAADGMRAALSGDLPVGDADEADGAADDAAAVETHEGVATDAPGPVAATSGPTTAPIAAPATDGAEPVVRRFPWTNAQPPMRNVTDDSTGPTRRNVLRRQAS